jgi:hypothetical protein
MMTKKSLGFMEIKMYMDTNEMVIVTVLTALALLFGNHLNYEFK